MNNNAKYSDIMPCNLFWLQVSMTDRYTDDIAPGKQPNMPFNINKIRYIYIWQSKILQYNLHISTNST